LATSFTASIEETIELNFSVSAAAALSPLASSEEAVSSLVAEDSLLAAALPEEAVLSLEAALLQPDRTVNARAAAQNIDTNLFMVESPFTTMGLGLVWGNGTPCHTAMLPQNDAGFQYSYNIHHLGLFFKGRALSNGG
jgi:hypothetical protein